MPHLEWHVFRSTRHKHCGNQRNRKANDHYRANCHYVVCNKISILEFMPRHPHSFELPRNFRLPRDER
jgi:hypothetical protein